MASPALAQQGSVSQTLTLASGENISAEVFGLNADGDDHKLRILWIAPSFGIQPRQQQLAVTLARHKLEVWLVDLPETLFLTREVQTLRAIPGSLVADIIDALSENNHSVVLMSSSYGAIPLLRGSHAWQERQPEQATLTGAILFSPALFTRIPALGESPAYIPELHATSIPTYIFQEAKNSRRWYLADILKPLQEHAPVYSEILPGVTSLFHDEDMAPETLTTLNEMPQKILRAIKQLQSHQTPLQALPLKASPDITDNSGLDIQLKPYRGKVQAMPFSLQDSNGSTFTMKDYSGQVTLINFWASWCRPCVAEIPSLNRLKQAMAGRAFQLISINYAEEPQAIREFMQRVEVDFPVLLDREGLLASQWKVVAFPSTFVIAPDGRIYAGVNAGIHWDTPAVIKQIERLLASPK